MEKDMKAWQTLKCYGFIPLPFPMRAEAGFGSPDTLEHANPGKTYLETYLKTTLHSFSRTALGFLLSGFK